ncbi:hypothetical protein B0H14DRAFT_2762155, partial [Mycena olivaceomarginata]
MLKPLSEATQHAFDLQKYIQINKSSVASFISLPLTRFQSQQMCTLPPPSCTQPTRSIWAQASPGDSWRRALDQLRSQARVATSLEPQNVAFPAAPTPLCHNAARQLIRAANPAPTQTSGAPMIRDSSRTRCASDLSLCQWTPETRVATALELNDPNEPHVTGPSPLGYNPTIWALQSHMSQYFWLGVLEWQPKPQTCDVAGPDPHTLRCLPCLPDFGLDSEVYPPRLSGSLSLSPSDSHAPVNSRISAPPFWGPDMGYAIAQAPPYPGDLGLGLPICPLPHLSGTFPLCQSDRLCSQAPAPLLPFYLERAFDPPPPSHPHPQNWLVPGATGGDSGQTALERISLISSSFLAQM